MDETSNASVKRRKVRKGTHSCWECKRRKVKCIFAAPDDQRCITCHRRDKKCIGQDIFDDAPETSPVSDVTGNSEFVSHGVGGLQQSTSRSTERASPQSSTSGVPMHYGMSACGKGSETQERATTTSLLTPAASPLHRPDGSMPADSQFHARATRALIAGLPSRNDLKILLQMISGINLPFYQKHESGTYSSRKISAQVTAANLYAPQNDPVLLARQMLLLVIGIQHLDVVDDPNLSERPLVIARRLAETAIDNVTSDDRFIESLEGLDNLVLVTCYHTNSGDVRRAWMTMRRCLMAAQLMGLQHSVKSCCKSLSDQNGLDPEIIWPCIITMERIISLVVGLPTSTSSINVTSRIGFDIGSQLPPLALDLARDIIHRNETQDAQKAVSMTQDIDRDLIKTSQQLPPDFWRPPDFVGIRPDSERAPMEIQRVWDHMCYQLMVNQLHLPDMLHSTNPLQSLYARNACIHASRETLHRQVALRSFNPIHPCCAMGDFMAMNAGIALMLAHIISHCTQEGGSTLLHQRYADRAIIERALECNHMLPRMNPEVVVSKAGTALRRLMVIEAAAAQDTCFAKRLTLTPEAQNGNNLLLISVQKTSLITIAHKEALIRASCIDGLNNRDGFVLGGIGYLHIDETTDQMPNVLDTRQQEQINTTVECPHVPNNGMVQHEQTLLPASSGNMDDWVFQGFDTTYIDGLMRGSTDMNMLGIMDQSWPVQ